MNTDKIRAFLAEPVSLGKTVIAMLVMVALLLLASTCRADPIELDFGEFRPAWNAETKMLETTFQLANLADGLQTVAIARNTDRFREVGEWRLITGSQPSIESALLAAALTGLAHWAVTEAMVRAEVSPWTMRAWQYVTIGLKVNVVLDNHDKGLRLGWAVRY